MIVDSRCAGSGRSVVGARLIQLLLALVVIAFPRAVLAKDVTVAVYVEGADAAAIRNTLLVNVPAGTTVAESDTFSAALSQHGQKIPFGKSLEGDARDRTITKVRTALASSGLDGAVIARVIKEKTQRLVKLLYVGAGRNDAAKSDEISLAAKRSKDDAGKLKAFLDSALASAEPEAAPAASKPAAPEKAAEPAAAAAASTPAPEAKSSGNESAPGPSSPDSTSDHPRGTVGKNLFEVEVGAEGAGRNFTYNQSILGSLREFSAFPVAMLAVNAEAYPFADSSGFLKDLGVAGSYSRSLFLTSAVAGGPNINTTESSYFVGLRYRIHPTSDPGFIIGITDGYAAQSVDFGSTTSALEAELPAADCTGNRLAIDARLPVGKLAIRAGFGWRAIFDTGVIGKRFTGTSAGGVDAQLGASYEVARGWEVRAIADYERYFYAFKPVLGDTYVAGGALDQFYGGRLALAYVY
jgi:hypothetical protein